MVSSKMILDIVEEKGILILNIGPLKLVMKNIIRNMREAMINPLWTCLKNSKMLNHSKAIKG